MVRRLTSRPAAGLLAAAASVLTPAAVLGFRFDTPDALLVLLLATAYGVARAAGREDAMAGPGAHGGRVPVPHQDGLGVAGAARLGAVYLLAGPPPAGAPVHEAPRRSFGCRCQRLLVRGGGAAVAGA